MQLPWFRCSVWEIYLPCSLYVTTRSSLLATYLTVGVTTSGAIPCHRVYLFKRSLSAKENPPGHGKMFCGGAARITHEAKF